MNGWKIFSNKTIHELESLRVHITRGCLSGINPGCGTNRNENLHRSINPFFSRCRIGIPLAIALLTVFFHRHNRSRYCYFTRCLYAKCPEDSQEMFGIIKKKNNAQIDDWIFGDKHTLMSTSLDESTQKAVDFPLHPNMEGILNIDEVFTMLQLALNLVNLGRGMQKQKCHGISTAIYVISVMPV